MTSRNTFSKLLNTTRPNPIGICLSPTALDVPRNWQLKHWTADLHPIRYEYCSLGWMVGRSRHPGIRLSKLLCPTFNRCEEWNIRGWRKWMSRRSCISIKTQFARGTSFCNADSSAPKTYKYPLRPIGWEFRALFQFQRKYFTTTSSTWQALCFNIPTPRPTSRALKTTAT